MRTDLVVVRCGRRSRHPAWMEGAAPRGFEVALCPYEDGAPLACDLPSLTRTVEGLKWTGLSAFLEAEPAWRDHGYVWLPDDDLVATADGISRFFDLCRRYDAALAAPALAEGSQYSHVVTLRNRSFVARSTTFVEIMAPCFRRDVLERLLPTFRESRTGHGWGLDDAWARLLGYRGIVVVDEVTVLHDRPVGAGRSDAEDRDAREEMLRLWRRFDAWPMRKTRGGFESTGTYVDEQSPRFLRDYLDGYRWLTDREDRVRRRVCRDQAQDPERWLRDAGRRVGDLEAIDLLRARSKAPPPGK